MQTVLTDAHLHLLGPPVLAQPALGLICRAKLDDAAALWLLQCVDIATRLAAFAHQRSCVRGALSRQD